MAKEAKKNNNLIIGICAAVAIVIIVVVAVVLANKGGNVTLDDSYFVSDNSKYVISYGSEDIAFGNPQYNPEKMHYVYTYSGDKITGLKVYYEYTDNAAAKEAVEYLKEEYEDTDGIAVEDKYIVVTAPEEEYEDVTPEQLKEQIEILELLKNLDFDDAEEEVEE
jgi:hypothetical protein